jgi:hypothetical protein
LEHWWNDAARMKLLIKSLWFEGPLPSNLGNLSINLWHFYWIISARLDRSDRNLLLNLPMIIRGSHRILFRIDSIRAPLNARNS